MQLYLSSSQSDVLERAQAYLENTLKAGAWKREKENGANRAKFTINLPDEAVGELLNQLLSISPDLDIEATQIYDLEGRDRSFWGSAHYQSTVDENGKRCFKVSTSTGWA